MKNFNKAKLVAIFVLTGILGTVLVAFQNFTPNLSRTPTDVSDLYMNTALSTALKTKETKDTDRQFALRRDAEPEEKPQNETSSSSDMEAPTDEPNPNE